MMTNLSKFHDVCVRQQEILLLSVQYHLLWDLVMLLKMKEFIMMIYFPVVKIQVAPK